MKLRSLDFNQTERNCSSGVLFMDVFSDPMCFSALYERLGREDKATLRRVNKELRDAVNLNVRGLKAELDGDHHEPVNMPLLILNLPNLESINASISFPSSELVSVLQGAQLARKLTKLELRDPNNDQLSDDEEDMPLTDEERERRAEVIGNSFGTINHHCWPAIRLVHLCGLDTTMSLDAMKGLLRLSTLTQLDLEECRFNTESFDLIQPDSWSCLRRLELEKLHLEDPAVAIRALLHLTGLEELSLDEGGITGEALAQIQLGSWPNLQVLYLGGNDLIDDPVGAMQGLLHPTTVTELDLMSCDLSGEAVSQIKAGDWPHLQQLKMSFNGFSDDPVGAMEGLLRLTSLQELNVVYCNLTGEAISQIKPGDWPHLQKLFMFNNDLSDDKEGARKGLIHLTSLDVLHIRFCGWTKEEVVEICSTLGAEV